MNSNYKNIFMFKNPIRHFLNAENLIYPSVTLNKDEDSKNIDWAIPIDFNIRKYYGKNEVRNLKIPNYLNFYVLFEHCSLMTSFYDFGKIGEKHSRIKVNLETGDFEAYSFQRNVEADLDKLTFFDTLFRFDIKSFYKSIYTHKLVKYTDFSNSIYDNKDTFITNINGGQTDGILMGNYISLYLAEFLLNDIMCNIKESFKTKNIPNALSNFSDDIYIFSFLKYKDDIYKIVATVLGKYGFELNDAKNEIYNYIEYNNSHTLTKEWKRVISIQKDHERYIDHLNQFKDENESRTNYYLNFCNQLIYRISKISDDKLKSIFAKNFFKSSYFTDLDSKAYNITKENMHQLKYIMSEYPETILYIIPKFKNSNYFSAYIQKWVDAKFVLNLDTEFHEEQLYYLFGIEAIGNFKRQIPKSVFLKCMETNNAILKSYMIMYHLPNDIDPKAYLKTEEENWFLNYHILLKKQDITNLEDDIINYLIPKSVLEKYNDGKAIGKQKKDYYMKFYKENIIKKILLIKEYEKVEEEIKKYLKLKKEERMKNVSLAQKFID